MNSCSENKVTLALEEYKQAASDLLLQGGASRSFVDSELTGTLLKVMLANNFSPEALAWALLQ